MKSKVTGCKNLKTMLKELEAFVRDGQQLIDGKSINQFGGLRPREIFMNWLLCAALNCNKQDSTVTFCVDPLGGDGIIYDREDKKRLITEHTMIVTQKNEAEEETLDLVPLILTAINKKQKKGTSYAVGTDLIIFVNKKGIFYLNNVIERLPAISFESIWIIMRRPKASTTYTYDIVNLDSEWYTIWEVCIADDFSSWMTNILERGQVKKADAGFTKH